MCAIAILVSAWFVAQAVGFRLLAKAAGRHTAARIRAAQDA